MIPIKRQKWARLKILIMYLIYMYKKDSALNGWYAIKSNKTKPNQICGPSPTLIWICVRHSS